jgi:hypothetical protein
VLFTSGHTGRVSGPKGKWDDTVLFLQKPFSPEDLLRQVRSVLDQ